MIHLLAIRIRDDKYSVSVDINPGKTQIDARAIQWGRPVSPLFRLKLEGMGIEEGTNLIERELALYLTCGETRVLYSAGSYAKMI